MRVSKANKAKRGEKCLQEHSRRGQTRYLRDLIGKVASPGCRRREQARVREEREREASVEEGKEKRVQGRRCSVKTNEW